MIDLKSVIEDEGIRQKYCSQFVYAKIGHAQILSHKSISDFEEIKTDAILQNPLPNMRIVLTTDKRVISIHDFSEDVDTQLLSIIVDSDALTYGHKKHGEKGPKWAVKCGVPFRLELGLEIADESIKDTWEDLHRFSPDISEVCWVWWDGNIFLAYTTDPMEANRDFGHKARDVLVDLFKDSDIFDGANVGPTPIHPDIMIPIFSKENLKQYLPEEDTLRLTRETIKLGEDIVFPILVDSEVEVDSFIHEVTRSVYGRLDYYIMQFYRVQMTRHFMMDAEMQCGNKLTELINGLKTMQDTSVYKFLYRRKLSKELGKFISEIQMSLLEEYALRTQLTDERRDMESVASRERLAWLIRDYFLEHTRESELIDRECVSGVLTHADQELARHSALNIQVISALLGAGLAVGLMYAGAYLFRLVGL